MKKIFLFLLVLGLSLGSIEAQFKLPQNRQNSVRVGPFVDATDGVTLETAIDVTDFTVTLFRKDKTFEAVTITSCVRASQTLTSDGTDFANNEEIVIGTIRDGIADESVTYVWKTVLTGAPNEILIAGTAAASLDNLKCAITDTGCAGEGTTWGTGTVKHPSVSATTNGDTTQVVEAVVLGSAANSIVTTETGAHASWGAGTLASGTDDCMYVGSAGVYNLALASTRWNTLGWMRITFTGVSGVAPHWENYEILSQDGYNVLVNGEFASKEDIRTEMDTNSTKLANLDQPNSQAALDVWEFPIPEPTGPLVAEPQAQNLFGFWKQWMHNKLTVASTGGGGFVKTFFNDAGTATSEQNGTDNGTTYTINKAETP